MHRRRKSGVTGKIGSVDVAPGTSSQSAYQHQQQARPLPSLQHGRGAAAAAQETRSVLDQQVAERRAARDLERLRERQEVLTHFTSSGIGAQAAHGDDPDLTAFAQQQRRQAEQQAARLQHQLTGVRVVSANRPVNPPAGPVAGPPAQPPARRASSNSSSAGGQDSGPGLPSLFPEGQGRRLSAPSSLPPLDPRRTPRNSVSGSDMAARPYGGADTAPRPGESERERRLRLRAQEREYRARQAGHATTEAGMSAGAGAGTGAVTAQLPGQSRKEQLQTFEAMLSADRAALQRKVEQEERRLSSSSAAGDEASRREQAYEEKRRRFLERQGVNMASQQRQQQQPRGSVDDGPPSRRVSAGIAASDPHRFPAPQSAIETSHPSGRGRSVSFNNTVTVRQVTPDGEGGTGQQQQQHQQHQHHQQERGNPTSELGEESKYRAARAREELRREYQRHVQQDAQQSGGGRARRGSRGSVGEEGAPPLGHGDVMDRLGEEAAQRAQRAKQELADEYRRHVAQQGGLSSRPPPRMDTAPDMTATLGVAVEDRSAQLREERRRELQQHLAAQREAEQSAGGRARAAPASTGMGGGGFHQSVRRTSAADDVPAEEPFFAKLGREGEQMRSRSRQELSEQYRSGTGSPLSFTPLSGGRPRSHTYDSSMMAARSRSPGMLAPDLPSSGRRSVLLDKRRRSREVAGKVGGPSPERRGAGGGGGGGSFLPGIGEAGSGATTQSRRPRSRLDMLEATARDPAGSVYMDQHQVQDQYDVDAATQQRASERRAERMRGLETFEPPSRTSAPQRMQSAPAQREDVRVIGSRAPGDGAGSSFRPWGELQQQQQQRPRSMYTRPEELPLPEVSRSSATRAKRASSSLRTREEEEQRLAEVARRESYAAELRQQIEEKKRAEQRERDEARTQFGQLDLKGIGSRPGYTAEQGTPEPVRRNDTHTGMRDLVASDTPEQIVARNQAARQYQAELEAQLADQERRRREERDRELRDSQLTMIQPPRYAVESRAPTHDMDGLRDLTPQKTPQQLQVEHERMVRYQESLAEQAEMQRRQRDAQEWERRQPVATSIPEDSQRRQGVAGGQPPRRSAHYGLAELTGSLQTPAEHEAKRAAQQAYQREIEKQIQEKKERTRREKQQREEQERKQMEAAAQYDPFGRPGGGAPTLEQRSRSRGEYPTVEAGILIEDPKTPAAAAPPQPQAMSTPAAARNDAPSADVSFGRFTNSRLTFEQRQERDRKLQEQERQRQLLREQMEERKRQKAEEERKKVELEAKENARLERERRELAIQHAADIAADKALEADEDPVAARAAVMAQMNASESGGGGPVVHHAGSSVNENHQQQQQHQGESGSTATSLREQQLEKRRRERQQQQQQQQQQQHGQWQEQQQQSAGAVHGGSGYQHPPPGYGGGAATAPALPMPMHSMPAGYPPPQQQHGYYPQQGYVYPAAAAAAMPPQQQPQQQQQQQEQDERVARELREFRERVEQEQEKLRAALQHQEETMKVLRDTARQSQQQEADETRHELEVLRERLRQRDREEQEKDAEIERLRQQAKLATEFSTLKTSVEERRFSVPAAGRSMPAAPAAASGTAAGATTRPPDLFAARLGGGGDDVYGAGRVGLDYAGAAPTSKLDAEQQQLLQQQEAELARLRAEQAGLAGRDGKTALPRVSKFPGAAAEMAGAHAGNTSELRGQSEFVYANKQPQRRRPRPIESAETQYRRGHGRRGSYSSESSGSGSYYTTSMMSRSSVSDSDATSVTGSELTSGTVTDVSARFRANDERLRRIQYQAPVGYASPRASVLPTPTAVASLRSASDTERSLDGTTRFI